MRKTTSSHNTYNNILYMFAFISKIKKESIWGKRKYGPVTHRSCGVYLTISRLLEYKESDHDVTDFVVWQTKEVSKGRHILLRDWESQTIIEGLRI